MKKVLVVGEGSYIGESFAKYVNGRLNVTTVGTLHNEWKNLDFSGFDSILHVAGVAHRKQSAVSSDIYFKVNRDLPVAVAQKAKAAGVNQFVFMSSLYAFGIKSGIITRDMIPNPAEPDFYGLSKYQAEKLLQSTQAEGFRVAIIRPPMVYGPGCKGNFPKLVKIAKLAFFVPTLNNKRSMIFIDNLTEFLTLIIENNTAGVLCPQNSKYVDTSNMIMEIATALNKKRLRVSFLNPFIKLFMPVVPPLNTAFGSLYYDSDISRMPFDNDYQVEGFKGSIVKSIDIDH